MSELVRARAAACLSRPFSRLWAATAASNLSDGLRLAVLPLLAATLTDNPALVAGVAVASQAPWLLLGLIAGAVVDRYDRRRLLAAAHMGRTLVVILLMVSTITGIGGLATVYAAALLLGAAETIFDNAAQALVPQLVSADRLEEANSRQALAVVGGQDLVGPLLGAALFTIAAPLALAVDAAGLALASVLVLLLPQAAGGRRRAEAAASDGGSLRIGLRAEMAFGARWLWNEPTLRRITLAAGFINVAIVAHAAVLVLYALEILHVGEVGYALLLAAAAIGGFGGAAFVGRVSNRLPLPWLLFGVAALAAFAVTAIGLTSNPWLAAGAVALVGAAGTVWSVVTATLRQRMTPDPLLGRVIGVHQLISWGGAALGGVIAGAVATAFGLRAPFYAGGVLLAAVAVALLGVRQPVAALGATTSVCADGVSGQADEPAAPATAA